MNIIFRVDASEYMGGGHLHRCLVLAQALITQYDAHCLFVMKTHPGHLAELVAKSDIDYVLLPLQPNHSFELTNYETWVGGDTELDAALTRAAAEDYFGSGNYDWVVLDHYGLDRVWESIFAQNGINIAVIDDLMNRPHNANILLDQTCGRVTQDYQHLVSPQTICLTGESFSLLRPEFRLNRKTSIARKRNFQSVQKVLLSFGSTDPGNITSVVLNSLSPFFEKHGARAVVIISSAAPHLEELRYLVPTMSYPIDLHVDSTQVAALLLECDIAVGAPGSATWERCALGVPTLLIQTAENQSEVLKRVCQFGAAEAFYDSPDSSNIVDALESVVSNYQAISLRASLLVDGLGSNRVIKYFKG